MGYRIVTVCHGNICRSPMAEVVLRTQLRRAGLDHQVTVDSAGVSGEEAGNPMDRRARRVLQAHHYWTDDHTARKITRADLEDADLVLAATFSQYRALQAMVGPDGARIEMIRAFDPAFEGLRPSSRIDMDDPWYGDSAAFELTLAEIEAACPGIIAEVRATLREHV